MPERTLPDEIVPSPLFLKETLGMRMLFDALDAVKAIYGDEGAQKVIAHMKAAERARASNAEIDDLERIFGAIT